MARVLASLVIVAALFAAGPVVAEPPLPSPIPSDEPPAAPEPGDASEPGALPDALREFLDGSSQGSSQSSSPAPPQGAQQPSPEAPLPLDAFPGAANPGSGGASPGFPAGGDGAATVEGGVPGVAPTGPGIEGLIALTPVEISWRVENPFRFFADPKDTEVHRATYLSLAEAQRENAPILASEHALSRRHEAGWAETMARKTCWLAANNRHVCPDKSDYVNPKRHNVVVSAKGVAEPTIGCRWITAELNRDGAPAGAESSVVKPCGESIVFSAPYPTGLSVRVEIGGLVVASTEIRVRDILVVGMGDSFGSGEGNPDVPVRFSPERTIDYGKKSDGADDLTGYPARVGSWQQVGDAAFVDGNARWLDQACHRSLYSYQLRTALGLAVEDPHRAVTYAGFACSGAEVTWGLFLRYKGNEWVPRPPDFSQISAVADLQCGKRDASEQDMPEAYHIGGSIPELQGGLVLRKCPLEQSRKIDLVLMSVGGNDIGFARLMANAVLSDQSLVRSLGGWFGQIHGNQEGETLLARLDNRYKALNRALRGILHIPWDESDRIILTAYPPFALLDDAGAMCRDGNDGMEVFSDFAITQKAALSSSWLADKLDQTMERSARAHGWSFVEAHRKAFVGRGMCAGHKTGLGPLVDDLRLPRRRDGVWTPYNPVHFEPYAARLRWFRTPNDAFLTGNFHVAGSVMQNVLKLQSFSWFQVLLASTYSGAFHPTAEGHAAIADAALMRARQVLTRHGQQSAAAVSGVLPSSR